MVPPFVFLHSKVRIPGYTYPVELQALNLKLRCSILQVEAGSRVFPIVKEPVNGIDTNANINRVRLEALRLRRRYQPISLGTAGTFTDPLLCPVNVTSNCNWIAQDNLF